MTKEEWVELFQAMNGRDPSPQEFIAAKNNGEFLTDGGARTVVEQVTQNVESNQADRLDSESQTIPESNGEYSSQEEGIASRISQVSGAVFNQDNVEKLKDETKKYASIVADTTRNATNDFVNYVKDTNNTKRINKEFYREYGSYFDGGILEYIVYSIGTYFLVLLTLGIATPWAICLWQGWKTRHTVINGQRLAFDGKGIQLLGNWIKWFLLTIITLGIYGFWLTIKVNQWIVKHTYFED